MNGGRFGWLVSYPRSGNTWLRILLGGLIEDAARVDLALTPLRTPVANRREFAAYLGIEPDLLLDDEIADALPALHRQIARHATGPLILRKVHQRCSITRDGARAFPPDLSHGVVYLVRDPRDVAVSGADYFGIEIDEAIARMADTQTALSEAHAQGFDQLPQPLGSWSSHAMSWLDECAMPALLVRYEDLLADTASELARVARFLGLPSENAPCAAETASFARLRAAEEARGFTERSGAGGRFFRQGRAGGWRTILSGIQADRLYRDHHVAMARFGYV